MLTAFIIWTLTIVSLFGSTVSLVHHGYMTQYYYSHKPVFVNDSMTLELTNKFLSEKRGERLLACDVSIVTSQSRRLMIHFLSLEISYADQHVDRLHIYDFKKSGEAERISPPQGLYGILDPYYTGKANVVADYESTSNRLKLDYQGKPTLAYNGFKILITSFRDSRGDCGRGYVRCKQKDICIPVSTWCDGNPNCGAGDKSDEENCDPGKLHTWNQLDGQITAVVAASVSCTLFFVTAALLVIVVLRLNKRDVINQNNITVQFKQKGMTKRQMSKTGEYAPPSYEVVIGMNGAPPPYQLVATPGETGSDVSFDEDDLVENGDPNYATLLETTQAIQNAQDNALATNNIRVTCDIHGNNIQTSEATQGQNGCLELTKLRLCSQGPENNVVLRSNSKRAKTDSLEIEVLESTNDPENDNNDVTTLRNGSVRANRLTGNGACKGAQLNGNAIVSFSTDLSANGERRVEFLGNEA